jgi:aminoglycoside 2'-N-acetyltransferase I
MPTVARHPTADLPRGYPTQIRGLLDAAFDGDFSAEDWEHSVGGCHVIAVHDDVVIGHAAVVPRVLEAAGRPIHTGYVEAVAVLPAGQRQGIGTAVMTEVDAVIREHYEMGALSTEVHGFYAQLGWERWRGPTYVRRDMGLIRSGDEDDGVMVLRFGRTGDVDLSAAISCEERSGSDW